MTSIPETMRVPRFVGGGTIDFREKPVPRPGPGELLLRVGANALCGSERAQFEHGSEVTPGHEAAGVVAAAGAGTRIAVGTPGVIFLMGFCGECRSCRLGHTNQCLDKRADMGFNRDGGYGAYELVDERIFFAIDADIPLVEATMLLDVMGTGGHALSRGTRMRPDVESVLVAGAGPIGLGVLAMARILFGAGLPVYIGDMVPFRLKLAERLGGLPLDLRRGTIEQELRRYGVERVDLAVDTSGRTIARRACVDALAQRGVLVCIGHGEGLDLNVSSDLIAPERSVLGSEYFRFDELPANLERFREHRDTLRPIITHRMHVSEIRAAFEAFFAGNTGKVVVEQS